MGIRPAWAENPYYQECEPGWGADQEKSAQEQYGSHGTIPIDARVIDAACERPARDVRMDWPGANLNPRIEEFLSRVREEL